MSHVDVIIADERWATLGDAEALADRAIAAALAEAGAAREDVTVSVSLGDDAAVRQLNRDWRGKDMPTNVLSFPAPELPAPGPRLLGDVALAYETVAREAEDAGKPLRDHAAHLLVHGTLHLLGYDHERDDEAAEMESLEVRALAGLGIPDPYRDLAA